MLRDRNLVLLSRQHHNALALCVRLERGLRARKFDPAPWQREIEQHFDQELRFHFDAEETILFPRVQALSALQPLARELLREHGQLRAYAARARAQELEAPELRSFAELLSGHARKEEAALFEQMQKLMPAEELAQIGSALEDYFRRHGPAGATCALPPR